MPDASLNANNELPPSAKKLDEFFKFFISILQLKTNLKNIEIKITKILMKL